MNVQKEAHDELSEPSIRVSGGVERERNLHEGFPRVEKGIP